MSFYCEAVETHYGTETCVMRGCVTVQNITQCSDTLRHAVGLLANIARERTLIRDLEKSWNTKIGFTL